MRKVNCSINPGKDIRGLTFKNTKALNVSPEVSVLYMLAICIVLYCIVFQTVSSPNSNPYYYELHVQFGERQLKNSSEGPFTVLCRAGMLCGKMGWVMCLVFNI